MVLLRNYLRYVICNKYKCMTSMANRRIKTVLVDLSGTVHIEDEEIPGSKDALKILRSHDVNLKFVTNTTKESKRCLMTRLHKIGFDIKPIELYTSLSAARHVIDKNNLRPMLMVDQRALEDFEGICTEDPNSVVIGLAPEQFDYTTMNKAFRLVLEGCPLIAIHKARYYKKTDELALGPGPFVTALEYATERTAEVVGKPQPTFFLSSVEEFNCKPEECVMIGDDVRDDVGGAQKTGMLGILVRTGKYRQGDEDKIVPKPLRVVDNFKQAVNVIVKELL